MFKKWLSHRNRFSNMFEGNLKITNKIVKNKFTCTFFFAITPNCVPKFWS